MRESIIRQLNDIIEFNEINEFLQDPDVEKGLLKLVSILNKPEINAQHVARHVVECQALSAAYGIKAKYYMDIGKEQEDYRSKKNLYMTMKESFHELAGALKYLVKASI
jgi:hypothetical protein